MRKRAVAVALCLVGLAALPACSDDEGRLTVYSGRTTELIRPLLEQFSDETGIAVDFRQGDSAELALLIDTEGDRSPADVFISQSPGAVGFLDQDDRLLPLPDDILGEVSSGDHAADGTWVGLTGRVRVLAYNTDQVTPADLPASVLELTDPRFDNRVGVAPGNGSFQDFVTAMRAQLGDDATAAWLSGMAANRARPYPNNVSILEAVARGEVAMGLINHYYDFRAKQQDPGQPTALHFFAPGDLGGLLLVTAAGVVDTTDQREEAERLVRFLLSEEAQRYFSEETLEYPLAAGVAPQPQLPPLADVTSTRVDFDSLGGGLARTQELIDRSGIGG